MSEEIKQINDIIERQFSGYKGNAYKKLEKLHRHMRRDIGDQRFLLFLKEQERPIDELKELIENVFAEKGLNSISYKEAAREIAELWLKQNQSK